MSPSIEDSDGASADIAHWQPPLCRLRGDVLCRAWLAAERTRRGTGQAPDVKRPGQTMPAVPTGRSAD